METVQREVEAQAKIKEAFTREAPKAAANFAQTRMTELKDQLESATTEEEKARIEAEIAKWEEGGTYRVGLHTVIGALAGGIGGAAGAAASASTAPYLNEMQEALTKSLVDSGMTEGLAVTAAKTLTGLTAAGMGAVIGGTAGAAGAAAVDFNNRQLHQVERSLIAKLAKEKSAAACNAGDAECLRAQSLFWTDTLERVAKGLIDDKADADNARYLAELATASADPASEGARGGLQRYIDALTTAQTMLMPYMGTPIVVNGQVAVADGSAQTYFSATAAQKADPYANTFLGSLPSSIAPAPQVRDEDRIEKFSAINGSAVKDYSIEELLLGGKVVDAATKTTVRLLGSEADLAFAGIANSSSKGNISASQITYEGLSVKLSATESTLLKTLDKLPSSAAGNVREYVADNYFLRNGWTKLEGKCGSSNCFDGVYVKGNQIVVNEVKPLNSDGTIRLSGGNDATDLQTQMSKQWVVDSIRKLANSNNPAAKETAALLDQAIKSGNLVKTVSGVNSQGMTVVKLK